MIENSIIFRVCISIWQKYLFFYRKSVFSKIANVVTRWIMSIWSGSFIRYLMFNNFKLEDKVQTSFIGKIVYRISSFFERKSPYNKDVFLNSRALSYCTSIFENLLYISVRSYGLTLSIFGLIAAAGRFWLGYVDRVFNGAVIAFLVGLVLIVVNKPAAFLFNRSYLCKLVGGIFGINELNEKRISNDKTIFFVVLGFVFAFLAIFVSPIYFVMAVGGIIGGSAILYRTEIGIFTAAFLMPLVPTRIILGLTLFTVISFLFHVITGRLKFRFQLLDFFVMLFALLLVYSLFISFRPLGSAPIVAVYLLFIGFYVAVKNTIVLRKQLYIIISLIVSSGFLVAFYGVFQRVTGSYESAGMWIDLSMFGSAGARVYSTLENPNVLGEFLIIIISLAVAMAYYFEKPIYKLGAGAIVLVSGLCMIFTLSRGAWLGLLFAALIFILLNDKRMMWFAVIGLLLAPLLMPQSIIDRFLSIGNIADTSTNYRVNIWIACLLMLRVFWPSGIGLGIQSFVFIYSIFAFNAVYAPHSHNLFLQVMIDLGITGFVAFMGFIATFFKNLILAQQRTNDVFLKILSGALYAALAGYLLQGMTDNVWYNYRVVCLFWLLLALSGVIYTMTLPSNPLGLSKLSKKEVSVNESGK